MSESYTPTDRRPIKSRERSLWKRVAGSLIRAGVPANSISIAGMVSGILAGAALGFTAQAPAPWPGILFVAAAACIQIRLIANMLDGMVAVGSGRASPVGELYNEVPDRVSDAAALIGAGYALGGEPVLGYVAALAAVMTAYIRAVGKGAGAGSDFSGPMAKQQRMAVLTGAALAAGLLPGSLSWQWGPAGRWSWVALALWIISAGGLITFGRRLLRLAAKLRAGPGGRP
jgi:phosphatidylglycerophosphate synthase